MKNRLVLALLVCYCGLTGCKTLAEADAVPAASSQTAAASKVAPANTESAKAEPAKETQAAAAPSGVFRGTGVLVKQKPAPPAAPEPEDVTLNFEGADIRQVIETILGDYLREPYLLHSTLTGTVSFRTTRGIAKKDLLPTLEMLLRMNGFALVREEGVYKILPQQQVRGSVTPQLGGGSTPLPAGYSVLVVPLRYLGARAMAELLAPFAADGNAVRADETRNLVILAGGQRELRHLLETIELFDVDFLAGMSVGLFPVKNVDAKSLTAELDHLFGGALKGVVRVTPIERLNALLVVTPQAGYLDEVKKWIERFDQAVSSGSGLHVYRVKNGKAENLAALLAEIFGGGRSAPGARPPQLAPGARPAEIQSPAQPGTPPPPAYGAPPSGAAAAPFQGDGVLISKDVRVVADRDNNALLVYASQGDYAKIEQALVKLDVPRRQVLVEVTIAEVRLTDDLRFGIEWFVSRGSNLGALRFPAGSSLTPALPRTPALAGADARALVTPTAGLQLINVGSGNIRAVLQALSSDGRAQLLSTPQIMAHDNEKAQIKVGERVSISTGTQTSATVGIITSEQYIDTGVLLAVTPRINASGQVTMEINQEVSEIGEARQGSNNPNIINRNFQTSATVGSGETVVLAGLIRNNRRSGTAGLPFLSQIPVLGALFGVQSVTDDRTELVILITPRIVADAAQAAEATKELRRKMPSLEGLLKPRAVAPAEVK